MGRIALTLLLLSAAKFSFGQNSSPSPIQEPGINPPLSYSVANFSDPNLDSPLQLPSTIMDGPPVCAADGTAFLQFWVPPPTYNFKEVFSISPEGHITSFALDRISGLSRTTIRSFDPGITYTTMLLWAQSADSSLSEKQQYAFYLTRFDYDGKLDGYSKLTLDFQPGQVAQLGDNSFLILGTDTVNSRPAIALIDSDGKVLQRLDTDKTLPSEDLLKNMAKASNFAGLRPEDLPPPMRLSVTLSMLHFTHAGNKLLMMMPGLYPKIIAISAEGQTSDLNIKLPKGQIGDSLLVSSARWLVRTHAQDVEDQSSLYEIDPETGATIREIRTGGVPATSIACMNDGAFYGFRWVNHKPYIMTATGR